VTIITVPIRITTTQVITEPCVKVDYIGRVCWDDDLNGRCDPYDPGASELKVISQDGQQFDVLTADGYFRIPSELSAPLTVIDYSGNRLPNAPSIPAHDGMQIPIPRGQIHQPILQSIAQISWVAIPLLLLPLAFLLWRSAHDRIARDIRRFINLWQASDILQRTSAQIELFKEIEQSVRSRKPEFVVMQIYADVLNTAVRGDLAPPRLVYFSPLPSPHYIYEDDQHSYCFTSNLSATPKDRKWFKKVELYTINPIVNLEADALWRIISATSASGVIEEHHFLPRYARWWLCIGHKPKTK
jgi:hypothetical protein